MIVVSWFRLGVMLASIVLTMSACGDQEHSPASERPLIPETVYGTGIVNSDRISWIEADYPTDVSDPRRLAGFADAIFVGDVQESSAAPERYGTPWRRMQVSVVESLKGGVAGTLTVEQQGGFNANGQLVLVNNDKLVGSGQYLFATRKSDRDSHVVIPVYGDVVLQLDSASALDSMRRAIADQIPFP